MCNYEMLKNFSVSLEGAGVPFSALNGDFMKKIQRDWVQSKKLGYQASGNPVESLLKRVTTLTVEKYYLRLREDVFDLINNRTKKNRLA